MLNATLTVVMLVAAVPDAPAQVQLLPRDFAQREQTLTSRESTASLLQGVGVTALILGALAGAGWAALELSQASMRTKAFWTPNGYGTYAMHRADYTPVAGVAMAIASAGLISLLTGSVMKAVTSSQRSALVEERAEVDAQLDALAEAAAARRPVLQTVIHAER